MILCVTLNPCLDKTLSVPPWHPGDNVRGQAVREVVGGKGNNVARALARLGHDARPVTFLGGPLASHCESLLREDDRLDPLIIPSAAPTRTILTVRSQGSADQTAFFDPDPAISDAEATALLARVSEPLASGRVSALTLSGSSPSPATHRAYQALVSLARLENIPTFLDTYGPALDAFNVAWPVVLQLNRREAGLHLRNADPSEADLLALLERWSAQGVSIAVVTNGPDPALAFAHGRRYRVSPPTIVPVNPIGSGDSLLAGLADAYLAGLPPEGLLRHAFGCAVANALVWDAGAVDPALARAQAEGVNVEPLP